MAYKFGSDKILFVTAGFLTIFGLLMVYNATSVVASTEHGISFYAFLKQLAYASVGLLCLVRLMDVDYHKWQNPKILYTVLAICAIALIFAMTQAPVNGARRWIRIGGFLSFQPSEAAKLAVIVFVAAFLHVHEDKVKRPTQHLVFLFLVIGFFAGLILIGNDLGQAFTVCFIAAIMLFVAGLSWKYYASAFLMAIPCFYFFVVRVPYRWERILTFLDPYRDPNGAGWHIIQSLTAVGSGGLTGLGLGAGKQKLFFLPEAGSDFIFAVIGEELGLLGTCVITCAFLIFFFRGMKIVIRSSDRFGFYLALGITLMVILPGLINMSMVLAMMPTKGIALPFLSQGGSSLLLNLAATGILLNLSHRNQMAAGD